MQRRLWLTGMSAAALVPGVPAMAQEVSRSEGVGVKAVQFPAWRIQGGQRTAVAPDDVLASDHEVQTGGEASIVMQLPDGSEVRLGEKTQMKIVSLRSSSSQGQTQVQADMRLVEGFFRFATTAVARLTGKRDIKVTVRTATIGIRGTDFWTMTDAVHDAACLFEGRVDLDTRDQGALVLDRPTAFWARFFDQPVRPVGNATPEELGRFIRSTELQPGTGVAVTGGRWQVLAAAMPRGAVASGLAQRLREAGFPAVVANRGASGRAGFQVRIAGLATEADASAVLQKIASIDGVNGRVMPGA